MKKRKSQKGLKLDPRSGDQFVDWTFRQFIYILNDTINRIRKKKNLRDSGTRKKLWGLLTDDSEIIIDSGIEFKEKLYTLIHEVAHALYSETEETKILQVEGILWRRFTEDQKRMLYGYIPKHVTSGPINE